MKSARTRTEFNTHVIEGRDRCKSFYARDLAQQCHDALVHDFSGVVADWNHARDSSHPAAPPADGATLVAHK